MVKETIGLRKYSMYEGCNLVACTFVTDHTCNCAVDMRVCWIPACTCYLATVMWMCLLWKMIITGT